jgi:hypothetical protein
VRAELVALQRIESTLQQCAEDGRLDVAPVGAGGIEQSIDLGLVEWQHVRVGEQAAVETQHVAAQLGGEATVVHRPPQPGQQAREELRLFAGFLQQAGEAALGQQSHILGEHGEQAAHQERRHAVGAVAGALQRTGERGELRGDLARDAGRTPRGVERQGLIPDRAQGRADRLLTQVFKAQSV